MQRFILSCISDSNIRLVNPCAATTSHYNTSFHLKIEDPLSLYNDCQCFIKDGEFRIYSVDIRLQSPDNDTCSLAKLQVNSETYKCDADSSTFGSVFNTEAGGLLPRGFVSLTKPRLNGQFQMAWLIIKPTGMYACESLNGMLDNNDKTRFIGDDNTILFSFKFSSELNVYLKKTTSKKLNTSLLS